MARGYPRIHRNVNMSYYNYSNDEEDFSRQIIRYWSNFIKTGLVDFFFHVSLFSSTFIHLNRNPNNDTSFSILNSYPEWKAYTLDEHNYIFFQLNNIHNERNYFDSMYEFWLRSFQTELLGGCGNKLIIIKMKRHITKFLLILSILLIILIFYFLYKCHQKKKQYRTPNDLLQYPNFITT